MVFTGDAGQDLVMTDFTVPRDLTRNTLAVLIVVLLAAASLWILWPFLLSMIWGATIAIATWPMLLRCEVWVGGRRWLAVVLMLGGLITAFLVPLSMMIAVTVSWANDVPALVEQIRTFELPPAPEWLQSLPLFGERAASAWNDVAAGGKEGLGETLAPHAGEALKWLVARLGDASLLLFHFALTAVFAAIFFVRGKAAAELVRGLAYRVGGAEGDAVVMLAGSAVRGVALGIVVTALVQAVCGGFGLWLAGVPAAGALTTLMFFLAVAQLGAAPVLFAGSAWLFWSGSVGWGIAMIVWGVIVGSMDNVLRALLIQREVSLPLPLLFAGVIGGLVAFGLIGLFVGPVLLAVTWTLLRGWIAEVPRESA